MATCLEIITRAARYLGVIRAGEALGATDSTDLMQHLQDVIDGLPLLINGEWNDVLLTDEEPYTAKDGDRIGAAEGVTGSAVLENTYVNDCDETVPHADLSRVLIVDAGPWVFASSNGEWRPAYGLETTSLSPFGEEDAAGLAALAAVSAAPEYGAEIADPVAQRAAMSLKKFRARFYRHAVTAAVYF